MQVKIVADARLGSAQAQFAALEAQVKALNAAMARTSMVPAGGSIQGFQQQQRAIRGATAAYNASLASSGQYRVEQLKLNDAIDKQVQLMQKQKLSMREVFGKKSKTMMQQVYREQLAMQQMASKSISGGIGNGSITASMAIPERVHKSWDTFNNRIGFAGHQLASASGAMVNWGKNTQWAGRQMMAGISMPIAAFGAAAGVLAYQVDKQMTRIQKVYDTTADANSQSARGQAAVEKELAQVRVDAYATGLNAAREYGSALTETLETQAELAAVGMRGANLQKSTNEIMRISMLGEIDRADTTKALIALQSTLRLTTQETTEAFNYMNAIENATSLSMADFAVAIPKAAAPIKMMGGDVKDLGLLLVAMKERGIEAGEGANAIKALMTRIYKPSKQVREEWQEIAKIDPLQVVKEEGGDIMKILPRISKALEGMNRPEKNKALAGLFGTYQVTRMNAMLEGIDQMGDKTTQTYRAMNVAGNTASENAKIAAREEQRARESVSGQFKRSLETLKAEIAQIGDPFLEVATQFLKGFGLIAKGFNAMPDWAKKGAVVTAMLAAMFGGVVMLVGLLGNFIGTGGKMIAMLMKSRSSFELLTKAQIGERIAAALARREFESQTSAAGVLTGQIMALNEAMAINARVMSSAGGADYRAATAAVTAQTARDKAIQSMGPMSTQATSIYGGTMGSKAGSAAFVAQKGLKGDPRGGMNAKEMERAYATNAKMSAQMAATEAKIASETAKTKSNMVGASVAGAAMAASMGAMMLSSNSTVDNLAQWVMMSSILVPAVKGLGSAAKDAATNYKAAAAAQRANAAATAATTTGTAAAAASAGKMSGGFMAARAGMAGMMGPIGWAALAIGAIGFGAYKWWQHEKKITKEKEAQNSVMSKQNSLLEHQLQIQRAKPKQLTVPSPTDRFGGDSSVQLSEELKGSKQGKTLIKAYDNGSNYEKDTIAAQQYMDVLSAVGGNAQKAQKFVEALFIAAGMGALEAQAKASDLSRELGGIGDDEGNIKIWSRQITAALDETVKSAETTGKNLADRFGTAVVDGGPAAANELMDSMQSELRSKWSDVFKGLSEKSQSTFKRMGLNGGMEIAQALKDYSSMTPYEFNDKYDLKNVKDQLAMQKALNDARMRGGPEASRLAAIERSMTQTIADQLKIKGDIVTMTQLQATWEYQLLSVTRQNAAEVYKRKDAEFDTVDNMNSLFGVSKGLTEEGRRQAANQVLVAAGKQEENTLAKAQAAINSINAKGVEKTDKKAKGFKNTLKSIPKNLRVSVGFDVKDMFAVQKAGMEGATNDIADAASAGFDERMDASLAGTQASWDRRIQAAENAGEKAQKSLDKKWERLNDRFDARWERRKDATEKYYDKRIESVEKAIEAEEKAEEIRQSIFEAEKTRIQRLGEMANKNIDFNMSLRTGNLDEAAKIRNDMNATAADWALSDAGDKSKTGSAARVDKLNTKKDKYDVEREKALKALDKREKDEKASLERREEREKESLERRTKANQQALQAQATAANNAAQLRWNREKASFDQRITLFKSYIARDQKDLERWMKQVGISYDQFGGATMRKGEQWSKFFERSMVSHMRQAGAEMASDDMWAGLGAKNAKEIAKGMGFPTMGSFKKFIVNGTMPDTFGQNLNKPKAGKASKYSSNNKPKVTSKGIDRPAPVRHGGGWVGGGSDNRKGVARTLKGLHPSETLINARKNEFVVNENSAKKFGPELEAMNRGISPNSVRNTGEGVGGGPLSGMAGMLMGAMSNGLMQGMGAAMQGAVAAKQAQMATADAFGFSGLFSSGQAGMYSDRAFSQTQLKNAAIIASVGSGMGMSKRDIQIGIMTAIAESGLINVKYGDRDSQGLFQQRPSQGWGTVAQVTDPEYAAGKFFSALKGVSGRGDMLPWLAAQAVQRSAFSDGSNYRQYWDNAQAIFGKGLVKNKDGFGVAVGGTGGWHRPSVPGKGWSNSHDYRNGMRSPLYAYNDGRIIESRAIRSGGSGQHPNAYPRGYSSYGVTLVVQGKDGNKVRYAHMWPGSNAPVGPVKGGAKIGESASTGNSSGAHTHFDVNGSEAAMQWFQKHGIGLKKGGAVKKDGMANIHKGEAVISPKRTKSLYKSLAVFGDVMNKVARTTRMGFGNMYSGGGVAAADSTASAFGAAVQPAAAPVNSNTPSSKNASTVRTGAYNVLSSTTNKSTKTDLARLMKMADVLALSEWQGHKGQMNPWFAQQGWGLHTAKGRAADTAVAWNKDKYNYVGGGTAALNNKVKGKRGQRERFAAYANLRDRQTGREFWQVAVHTTNKANASGKNKAIQNEQWKNLNLLYQRLKATGEPVIMGGDFNASAKRTNQIAKGLRTPFGKGIDHIITDASAKLIKSSRFKTGLSSDHPAVLANYKLPQMKKGGTVKFDNTLANLHKDERVLTAGLSKEFERGVKNFASGGNTEYNLKVELNGANMNPDDVANVVMRKIKAHDARLPQRRS